MIRVLVLGTIVAIGCGVLLGATVAYEQWVFAMGALILGVGGASVVALAGTEPVPAVAPVILSGPVVSPTVELEEDPEAPDPETEPDTAPTREPAPVLRLNPNAPVPTAA
ncbi:hypothetical protein [Myceligenerans crystallogenes]|uniref:Uncharacterized protein n=1 Tax=Myceligenerans crystallogenes TaxID=316335 RepID=A0ABP4ZSC9_9MICO